MESDLCSHDLHMAACWMIEAESRKTSEPIPNKSPLALTELNNFFKRELFFSLLQSFFNTLEPYMNDNNMDGQWWVLLGPDGNLENVSDSDLLVSWPSTT